MSNAPGGNNRRPQTTGHEPAFGLAGDAEMSTSKVAPRRAVRAEEETSAAVHRLLHETMISPRLSPFTWPWWRTWSWLVITALAAAAYGLAVAYGPDVLSDGRVVQGSLGHNLVDALKLFPSGFPGVVAGPWQYVLARQLAAVVSLIVTLRVIVALFSNRFSELVARFRRGHAVVCGLGETGLRSTRAFRAAGYRVTAVDIDPAPTTADVVRGIGALVLRADATMPSALRTARVQDADYVICSCPDDAMNTHVASTVAALSAGRQSNTPLGVHVHIDNPDLAHLLRAPLASVGPARFHFFNVSAVWARAILESEEGPFHHLSQTPPRIVVLGCTNLGRALAIGAARRWHEHARRTNQTGKLALIIAGSEAVDTCAALAGRYPAIERVCELTPLDQPLSSTTLLDLDDLLGRESRARKAVYVSLDDQSANLALALDAEHRLAAGTSIFLPAAAAAEALGPLFLGAGRIRPISLPYDAGSIELLHDHMRESLAVEAHQAYRDERMTAAREAPAQEALARQSHEVYLAKRSRAPDFGSRPADRPWRQLAEPYRQASRAHIDGMVDQLRAVWYLIEPLYDWDEPTLKLDQESVEAMAELEHLRWCRERQASGWRYGTPRDDARKRHDLIVPWANLPEEAREIDREFIRRRPAILARAGFRLERDPAREDLARRLHERYVEARLADPGSAPHQVSWGELPETARQRNRATVDHIAIKLARIGCRMFPRALGAVEAMSFTDADVETLAEMEHERWLTMMTDSEWAPGERDDRNRTHPDLIAWNELSDTAREKDREVVGAIPELLQSVGYCVVRDLEVGRRAPVQRATAQAIAQLARLVRLDRSSA
jgi:voltage-gated potassium channel Kch